MINNRPINANHTYELSDLTSSLVSAVACNNAVFFANGLTLLD